MKKQFPLFGVFLVFLFFSILFNFNFYQVLFSSNPYDHIAVGESALAEFTVENSYQNLLKLENPYFLSNSFLYPYTSNLAINDPGVSHALFFFILRPFFDIHSSMIIILLINNLLSSVCMFFLLRRFNVRISLSLLFSLCFSFTPFISYRVLGHYIYTPLYIFPLLFLLIHAFFYTEKRKMKLLFSFLFSSFMAFILMLNLYYFVTILLGFLFYFLYYIIWQRRSLFQFIQRSYSYIVFSFLVSLLFLIPWIYATMRLLQFEGLVKTPGFGGAITLSADILTFVTPSEYNPFYHYFISSLGNVSDIFKKYKNFYSSAWDGFAYPGILLLFGYPLFIFLRKKLPSSLRKATNAHFFASLLFAVLLLGPFLKVFKRFVFYFEDVGVVIPLPFLLLHYIPGLSSIRAPTRFMPAFVFLVVFIVSLFWEHIFTKHKKKLLLLFLFFIIFSFDQFYSIPRKMLFPLSLTSYEYIKKDSDFFSVLEIPFTVRDGFNYIGFVHAINPLSGSLIHHKPIIGGYTARVHPSIFSYYKNLPFIGYIARIIDKGNYNPDKELPGELHIVPFEGNLKQAAKELDFLDVKYILLKNDEKYSQIMKELISPFGFQRQLTDNTYDIYIRQPQEITVEKVSFGSEEDYLSTAQGFSIRENGFRWIEGKIAKIFLKTNDLSKTKLLLTGASFYKPQDLTVYVNNHNVGIKTMGIEKSLLSFDISGTIKLGINTIMIQFTQNFKPAVVLPQTEDKRNLSAQLFSITIK